MAKRQSKAARDNRANQLNPTHPAYHRSRGASPGAARRNAGVSKPASDSRSRQPNPKVAGHRASRGGDASVTPEFSNPSSPLAE